MSKKIKFCGGCNPLYDRKKVYQKIILRKDKINRNIILNGCQRGCYKTESNDDINTQDYILINLNSTIDIEKIFEWILEKLE